MKYETQASNKDIGMRSTQCAAKLLLWIAVVSAPVCLAQERRVYEGVVSWKKATIGTVILMEINNGSVSGWMRLGKPVPLQGRVVSETAVEFQAGANTYQIDERKGRITYSGPDGEGSRLVARLGNRRGSLKELVEETRFSGGQVAALEVGGRRHDLRFRAVALWKRAGPPFESFTRLEELIGKELSVWVADEDLRSGRIVVVEEPEGMDIPLKAAKKPKEEPKKN